MKKLNVFFVLVTSVVLLTLQSCSSGTSFFVEMFGDDGIKLGSAPCDDCLISTMTEVEGVDAVDYVHGGTCPQFGDPFVKAAAAGSPFAGLWPFSLACTDEDGFATLNSPCADVTDDCKTNDETFIMAGVDNFDAWEIFDYFCCDVLGADSEDTALFFDTLD